jgi:tol-pal system protein YbgF
MKVKGVFLATLIFMPALLLSGCLATSQDMVDMRDDMYQLLNKLNELQRNQADLSVKMDTVVGKMDMLASKLEDTQNRMSLLSQRLDDVETNLSQREGKLFEQLSGTALNAGPMPSDLYRMAYGDFSAGKYDLAITGFKSYLEKYATGALADQSQYYIGESYYAKNNWKDAFSAFETVEKVYPASSLLPAARLKKAGCLEQMGKAEDSKALLQALVKDYPASAEAQTAREKLGIQAPSNGK